MGAEEPGSRQNVIAGHDVVHGVAVGSGNVQINVYGRRATHGQLVVGNIPASVCQAFQPRGDLLAQLRSAGGSPLSAR